MISAKSQRQKDTKSSTKALKGQTKLANGPVESNQSGKRKSLEKS